MTLAQVQVLLNCAGSTGGEGMPVGQKEEGGGELEEYENTFNTYIDHTSQRIYYITFTHQPSRCSHCCWLPSHPRTR